LQPLLRLSELQVECLWKQEITIPQGAIFPKCASLPSVVVVAGSWRFHLPPRQLCSLQVEEDPSSLLFVLQQLMLQFGAFFSFVSLIISVLHVIISRNMVDISTLGC
jgi:hypothetical protein